MVRRFGSSKIFLPIQRKKVDHIYTFNIDCDLRKLTRLKVCGVEIICEFCIGVDIIVFP